MKKLTHRCWATGCERQITLDRLMCLHHWSMLPKRLKDRIWQLYRPGQETIGEPSQTYLKAIEEARAFIAEAEGRT
jgi:hypothetical protein